MAKTTRLFKSFSKLLLPVIVLIIIAVIASAIFLNYLTANAPKAAYLVLPEKYGQLSARGSQITDETWANGDGTNARGWLLKGAENAPAVILLHRYGADRSHLLNLGVKLSEATNFTILMPDLRGHGENPPIKNTSFGGAEGDDTIAAVNFLRGLKTASNAAQVGGNIGVYGVEMGSLAALNAAAKNDQLKVLVLDSVPQSSDAVLADAVARRLPLFNSVTAKFAQLGTFMYFYDGTYRHAAACDAAKSAGDRQILLLSGSDAPQFQDSTVKLGACFPPSAQIVFKNDLNPSGINIINASLEQSEAYDQRVIDFFREKLNS